MSTDRTRSSPAGRMCALSKAIVGTCVIVAIAVADVWHRLVERS